MVHVRSSRTTLGRETSTLVFAAPEMRVRLQDSADHELLAERDRVSILLVRDQP